jgi:hypothetical protein
MRKDLSWLAWQGKETNWDRRVDRLEENGERLGDLRESLGPRLEKLASKGKSDGAQTQRRIIRPTQQGQAGLASLVQSSKSHKQVTNHVLRAYSCQVPVVLCMSHQPAKPKYQSQLGQAGRAATLLHVF